MKRNTFKFIEFITFIVMCVLLLSTVICWFNPVLCSFSVVVVLVYVYERIRDKRGGTNIEL